MFFLYFYPRHHFVQDICEIFLEKLLWWQDEDLLWRAFAYWRGNLLWYSWKWYKQLFDKFSHYHVYPVKLLNILYFSLGYFDARDHNEARIRAWVKKGGMIILLAKIHHWFTLDEGSYIKVLIFSLLSCVANFKSLYP